MRDDQHDQALNGIEALLKLAACDMANRAMIRVEIVGNGTVAGSTTISRLALEAAMDSYWRDVRGTANPNWVGTT